MQKTTSVSVIIPTYNQAARLALTLQSFCYQRGCDNYTVEIIVVNDGSTDKTREILQGFNTKIPLRIIQQENAGRAAARNAGIRASSGSLILFTDCDRLLSNYWLQNHISFHHNKTRVAGTGDIYEFFFFNLEQRTSMLLQAMGTNFASCVRLARSFPFWEVLKKTLDAQGNCQLKVSWLMALTCNLSLEKDVLEEVGLFDDTLKGWGFEHFELAYRLQKAGVTFWRVPNAENYHLAHTRPKDFYDTNMKQSLRQLTATFPDPILRALWALFHGKITLGEFEQIATGEESHLAFDVQNVTLHMFL